MNPLSKISGEGQVAAIYGLEEAVFLDSIMFWYRTNRADNRNFHEGRWWTYNSIKAYEALFPWWNTNQIRRIIENCKKKGALLSNNFNKDQRDRTIWYSPSDDLLKAYGESVPVKCICENPQMESEESTDGFAGNHEPLPCNYHVDTSEPPYNPPEGEAAGSAPEDPPGEPPEAKRELTQEELFDAFWTVYPRKDKKQDAWKAWKKLKPDLPLCRIMSAALKKEKQTEKWTKEGGRYIPLASTWLNGREWENQGIDHTQICVQQEAPQGGWSPDPEVVT